VISGIDQRRRHLRKYSEGRLRDDKSFFFRGADGRSNLRAYNLTTFVELADGVDEATWHCLRRDYSRWIANAIKDSDLAAEVGAIEAAECPPADARRQVRDAIMRRYTLPA